MSDINVNIKESDMEACYRFGNRKSCNEIFKNKKKLTKVNNQKHNFREGAKLVKLCESLTAMNGSISFNCRKLEHKKLIHSCYSRNGVINIKITYKSQPVKIFHMERLVNLSSNFEKCTLCISECYCLSTFSLLTSSSVQ